MASLLVASMMGFTCQAVRGFPTFAPCLEHVWAGGGGEGSVANEGLVLIYRPADWRAAARSLPADSWP